MDGKSIVRPRHYFLGAAALVVGGVVLGLGLSAGLNMPRPVRAADATYAASASAMSGAIPESPFVSVVEKTLPAVVFIDVQKKAGAEEGAGGADDFMRRFFGDQGQGQNPHRQQRVPSSGSGFIIDTDGRVLTNNHVVKDAETITVTLNDGRSFKARTIGTDPETDVAVIKIDATSLPTVKIGDISKLRVGEWVIAIGSPFGFANTVTAGIVSAKSRENLSGDPNTDAVPFIQTDVAVNPGNSGGPLLNMRGEVVGINSQIFSRTGSFAGISFAIPIDYAFNVADQIMKTGHVTRGRIGVSIQNVSRDLADSLGLGKADGAVVGSVEADSPASKAGLEAGDVITRIDGRGVEGSADLSRTIRSLKPGSKVMLTVWRSGKTRDFAVTIAEFKDEDTTKVASSKVSGKEPAKVDKLGLAVKEVPAEQKKALKITGGVAVEAVDGAAQAAGVDLGDVILRVNNTEITGVKSFNEAVAKLDVKKPVALLIKSEDGQRYITFRPEVG